ncbi:MAG: hypothetical protein OEV00_01245 [Acidobacteriota bacterium]|nr:hypothetical protein [Acidobacteriota bacterium]MDH3783931.1 hypothetical protein [Acidobacteriota bacterium]
MRRRRLVLAGPTDFSFVRTTFSHGWSDLAPFSVSDDGRWLECTVRLDDLRAIDLRMERDGARRVNLIVTGGRKPSDLDSARSITTRILQLDLDLAAFRRAMRGTDRWDWMARGGWGRMLRAPTVFEDLIKMILTTNCSWAFTRKMAAGLVDRAGSPGPSGRRAFPSPTQIAALPKGCLRDEIHAGYRAPYLREISEQVASGKIDPEGWVDDPREIPEMRKSLLELPGVGPYVADNILRLLGRPSGLGLDSFLRGKYAEVFHGGRTVKDLTIERRYRSCGEWRAVAMWCEMTRDWFDDDGVRVRS